MKNEVTLLTMILLLMFLGCYSPRETVITAAHLSEDNSKNIEIFATEHRPAHVVVEFNIFLSGCESFHSVDYWWDRRTCIIEPNMSYPTGGEPFACPDAVWDHKVSVFIGRLEVGLYQVRVNNVIKEFEITKK